MITVYIDDLSAALAKCRTGCCNDGMNVNHLTYADDLIAFSPSSVGLWELLSVHENGGLKMKLNLIMRKVQYS